MSCVIPDLWLLGQQSSRIFNLHNQQTARFFFLIRSTANLSLPLCFKSSSILHFADNRVINQHESLLSCLFTIFDIHNTQQKMDATTHAQPLADRPTNTHLANVNVNNDLKTDLKSADLSSMEQHRQMLQDKLDNGEKWVPHLFRTAKLSWTRC